MIDRLYEYVTPEGIARIHAGASVVRFIWLDGDIRAFEGDFDESKVNRQPAGVPEGGQFAPKEGGGGRVGAEAKRVGIEKVGALAAKLIANETEAPAPEPDDNNDDKYAPDSWDTVTTEQQEETKEKWKSANEQSYYESEVESWWENSAEEELRGDVFNNDKAQDKAAEHLIEILEAHGADLQKSGITNEKGEYDEDDIFGTLWDHGSDSDWQYNHGNYDLKNPEELINDSLYAKLVDEDGKHLFPEPSPAGQLEFPGMPQPGEPHETILAGEILNDFEKDITNIISEPADYIDAPDPSYFQDSISEYMDESFDNMSDSQKFSEAEGFFGDTWEGDTSSSEPQVIQEPSQYKLISDGKDYERTKALGNALTVERFKQTVEERNIEGVSAYNSYVNGIWNTWKGKSTHDKAYAFQAAAAAELGGNFYAVTGMSALEIAKWADDNLAGGFEGMKAYVRAQWEVNQYLMEKAGVDSIAVYRAVFMTKPAVAPHEQKVTLPGYVDSTATALPTLYIPQNGAASFTVHENVANGWAGVGNLPPDPVRVVIRAKVPASAILSLPVFGKNMHNEQEVVVAGLPWKTWDAWKEYAPQFSDFELEHPRDPKGRFIDKPDEMKKAA